MLEKCNTLICFVCLLLPAFSRGQQNPHTAKRDVVPDSVFQTTLDSITVTATRSPKPLMIAPYAIEQLRLKPNENSRPGLSIAPLLNRLPGVWVSNRSNLSQGDRIAIRGMGARASFGVRGVKILLDGIPLSLPDGQAQLNNIDLSSVGRIEVLRGPGSVLYGNAAGGIIQIETASAPAYPLHIRLGFIAGADQLRRWIGTLSRSSGKNSFSLHFNRLSYAGYRMHSAARSTRLNARGRLKLSNRLTVSLMTHYFDAPYLLNPSTLDKETAGKAPRTARPFVIQQAAGKQVRQWQGGMNISYSDPGEKYLDFTFYHIGRKLLNAIPGRVIDLDRSVNGLRVTARKQLAIGKSQLLFMAGFDYERQNDLRREYENLGVEESEIPGLSAEDFLRRVRRGALELDQNEFVTGTGVFAEAEWRYRSLALTGGLRLDRYQFKVEDRLLSNGDQSGVRTFHQLSPMAGLSIASFPGTVLYLNYTTAFQTPTTTELGNSPAGAAGFNTALNPERTLNYELGIKGADNRNIWIYQLALFRIHFRNLLIPYQLADPGSEAVYYRNAGAAGNTGLETTFTWQVRKNLSATFSYTFAKLEYDDYRVEVDAGGATVQLSGNKIPAVPAHRLLGELAFRTGRGFSGIANIQWVGRYFANDFNGPPPGSPLPEGDFVNDAYLNVHLSVGREWQLGFMGLRLNLGVDNLLDQHYNGSVVPNAFGNRFFEPAPGRQWYGSISIAYTQHSRH
jgi:iron complex outermembrane receptor protein